MCSITSFSAKPAYLFVLAWVSLRLRGMSWKEIGFERPSNWGRAFGVGIAVGLAMEALELFVTQPLLARWIGKMPDLSDFADLVGNVKLFADLPGVGLGARSFGRRVGLPWLPDESNSRFIPQYESGLDCELGRGQRCVWLRAFRPRQYWHG